MLRSAAAELRKEIHMNVQISHRLHASAPAAARALVRIVIVGEVDHGKSTLIGRLLHEAGGLPDGKRYRSLGDSDITFPVESNASTIDEIIAELEATRIPERSGRAMDHESEDAFERLRKAGYL